jgi:hypothetical protein
VSDPAHGPFTLADFELLSDLVVAAWQSAVDADWSVPAGTLEWSCLRTADHTVDCVFSYALFLASGRQDDYPPFTELHALPEATPADVVNGLRAVTTMLSAVIAASPPDARAIIRRRPAAVTAPPGDFAARGALEMVLHAHDVCTGLGVPFAPPADVCGRLYEHTDRWGVGELGHERRGPWSDLLERSGRTA